MGEVHCECVGALFPRSVLGPGDFAEPLEHVCGSIFFVLHGLGYEAERMVAPPIFAFFFESADDEFIYLFFLHWAGGTLGNLILV